MNQSDTEDELQVAAQLARLAHAVVIDAEHKYRLRADLLRRHGELTESRRRPVWRSWAVKLRRYGIVAPVALVSAAAATAFFLGVQISGHQSTQTAEAARITSRLVSAVPTVTSWQVTVHRVQGGSASSQECRPRHPLTAGEHLYLQNGHTYLYRVGKWYRVTFSGGTASCSGNWEWPFAELATRLSQHRVSIVAHQVYQGRPAVEVRYTLRPRAGLSVRVVVWIDPDSGLIRHLDRTTTRNGRVIAQASADYQYQRKP